MAIVGSAYVVLRPLLEGFDSETQAKLDAALAAQSPVVDTEGSQEQYDALGDSATTAATQVDAANEAIVGSNTDLAASAADASATIEKSQTGVVASSETTAERVGAAQAAISGAMEESAVKFEATTSTLVGSNAAIAASADTTAGQVGAANQVIGDSSTSTAAKVSESSASIDTSQLGVGSSAEAMSARTRAALLSMNGAFQDSTGRWHAANGKFIAENDLAAVTSEEDAKRVAAGAAGASAAAGTASKQAASDAEASAGIFGSLSAKLVGGATVGIAAMGALAADTSVKYQDAIAQLQGVADITAAQAQKIGQALQTTTGTTTFSATQLAQALAPVDQQLSTLQGSSLTAAQALEFMKAASNEALGDNATGLSGLESTTSSLSTVMRAFSIQVGGSAATVNTLFNTTAALGQPLSTITTSLARLHSSLGDLAPTLSDVSTLMVDAAEHGLVGSRGVNTLGSAFQKFLGEVGNAPTDVAKALQSAQDSVTSASASIQSAQNSAAEAATAVTEAQLRLTAATTEYTESADPTVSQSEAITEAQLALTAAEQRHSVALQNVTVAQTKAGEATQKLQEVQSQSVLGTNAATATLKQLGISTIDVGGKFEGLRALIGQLQPALAKLTPAQRDIDLYNLFGSSAQKVGQIILAGTAGYDRAAAAVDRQGAAAKAAADKLKTLSAEWDVLKSSLENVLVPVGQIVINALSSIITPLEPLIKVIGQQLGSVFTALAPTLTALGPVIAGVVQILGVGLVDAIRVIAPVVDTVVKAFGFLLPPILKLLPPISALVDTVVKALAPGLAALLPPIEAVVGDLSSALGPALAQIIGAMGPLIATIGTLVTAFAQALGPVFADLVKGITPLLGAIATLVAALATSLGPVLSRLVPPIIAIIDVVAKFAGQIGNSLAPFIIDLIPLMQSLVGVIGGLAPALAAIASILNTILPPLADVITAITQFTGGLLKNKDIADALIVVLGVALAPLLAGKLITAVNAARVSVLNLGTSLDAMAGKFVGFIKNLFGIGTASDEVEGEVAGSSEGIQGSFAGMEAAQERLVASTSVAADSIEASYARMAAGADASLGDIDAAAATTGEDVEAVSAGLGPLGIAAGVAAVGVGVLLDKLNSDQIKAFNDQVNSLTSAFTNLSHNTVPQAETAMSNITVALANLTAQSKSGAISQFTYLAALAKLKGAYAVAQYAQEQLQTNTRTLQNQTGLTATAVTGLANSIGIKLNGALTSNQIAQFNALLNTQARQAGITEQALVNLANSTGRTTTAISAAIANARAGASQAFQSFTSQGPGQTGTPDTAANLAKFYQGQAAQGQAFVTNLHKALAEGYDPSYIAQLAAQGPSQAGPIIATLVTKQGQGLKNIINQTQSALRTQQTEVENLAGAAETAVVSKSKSMQAQLGSALDIEAALTSKNVSASLDAVAHKYGLVLPQIITIAKEYGLALPNSILAAVGPAETSAETVLHGIFGKIQIETATVATYSRTLGSALTTGILTGLNSNINEIQQTIGGAMELTIRTAKSTIRAASPSLRTRDEVGLPLMQGVALGITDNAHLPSDAIDLAMKAAIPTDEKTRGVPAGASLVQGLTLGIAQARPQLLTQVRQLIAESLALLTDAKGRLSIELFGNTKEDAAAQVQTSGRVVAAMTDLLAGLRETIAVQLRGLSVDAAWINTATSLRSALVSIPPAVAQLSAALLQTVAATRDQIVAMSRPHAPGRIEAVMERLVAEMTLLSGSLDHDVTEALVLSANLANLRAEIARATATDLAGERVVAQMTQVLGSLEAAIPQMTAQLLRLPTGLEALSGRLAESVATASETQATQRALVPAMAELASALLAEVSATRDKIAEMRRPYARGPLDEEMARLVAALPVLTATLTRVEAIDNLLGAQVLDLVTALRANVASQAELERSLGIEATELPRLAAAIPTLTTAIGILPSVVESLGIRLAETVSSTNAASIVERTLLSVLDVVAVAANGLTATEREQIAAMGRPGPSHEVFARLVSEFPALSTALSRIPASIEQMTVAAQAHASAALAASARSEAASARVTATEGRLATEIPLLSAQLLRLPSPLAQLTVALLETVTATRAKIAAMARPPQARPELPYLARLVAELPATVDALTRSTLGLDALDLQLAQLSLAVREQTLAISRPQPVGPGEALKARLVAELPAVIAPLSRLPEALARLGAFVADDVTVTRQKIAAMGRPSVPGILEAVIARLVAAVPVLTTAVERETLADASLAERITLAAQITNTGAAVVAEQLAAGARAASEVYVRLINAIPRLIASLDPLPAGFGQLGVRLTALAEQMRANQPVGERLHAETVAVTTRLIAAIPTLTESLGRLPVVMGQLATRLTELTAAYLRRPVESEAGLAQNTAQLTRVGSYLPGLITALARLPVALEALSERLVVVTRPQIANADERTRSAQVSSLFERMVAGIAQLVGITTGQIAQDALGVSVARMTTQAQVVANGFQAEAIRVAQTEANKASVFAERMIALQVANFNLDRTSSVALLACCERLTETVQRGNLIRQAVPKVTASVTGPAANTDVRQLEVSTLTAEIAQRMLEVDTRILATTGSLFGERQLENEFRQTDLLGKLYDSTDRILTLNLTESARSMRGLQLSIETVAALNRLVIMETADGEDDEKQTNALTALGATSQALVSNANKALAETTTHFNLEHELAQRSFTLQQQELQQQRTMVLLLRQQIEILQKPQNLKLQTANTSGHSEGSQVAKTAARRMAR